MQLNELSAFQNVPVIFWFKKHNHSNCDCVMMTKIEHSLVLNPGPAEIIFALEPQRTRRWARHICATCVKTRFRIVKRKMGNFQGRKETIRSTLFKAPTQGPTTILGAPYGVACLCVICFPVLPLVQLGRGRSCQTKASAWEGLCWGQIEEAGGGPDFNGRLQFESMFLTTLLRVIRQ